MRDVTNIIYGIMLKEGYATPRLVFEKYPELGMLYYEEYSKAQKIQGTNDPSEPLEEEKPPENDV